MLNLPLSNKTFTRGFLGGNGSVSLGLGGGAAFLPAQPFPDGTRTLVATQVAGDTPDLQFGGGAVTCEASFGGGVGVDLLLFQPGDATPLIVKGAASPVPDGMIGALFRIKANGRAAAGAAVPGPAGFSFGLSAKAGSEVGFARYRAYARARPAQDIVLDLLSDLRLPDTRGTPATLPQADEIVQFNYNGFIELGAALNWGYALFGSEGFKVRDIAATVEYAFKAKAAVTVNYRLAGEYTVTVLAGRTPGFVRVVVNKRHDAKFEAAAGFDFSGRAELKGLPETPNEFLGAFLGTDVQSVLEVFDKVVTLSDLKELEQASGKLLTGVVQDLAHKWIDKALDQGGLQPFLAELNKAVAAYKTIDAQAIATVTHLYERLLGPEKETLERALAIIKGLNSREDLARVVDPKIVDVIQLLTGGDIFATMFGDSQAGFAKLHETVARILEMAASPDFSQLRDVIDSVKSRLKLDVLFGKLEQLATPKKLKALTDKTLQGLIEKLLDKTFDEIKKSSAGTAVKELHDTLAKLQKFKDTFNNKIQEALEQSVSLQINYLYSKATADRALLDVEIDVRTAAGEQLFRDAVAGRMRPVFDRAQGGLIRVNDALLSHEVTRSSQLQINVLGWERKRLVEVIGRVEHSLQAHHGGLVQVYTTETVLKELAESGRSNKEKTQTNFVLRMAGEEFGDPSDPKTQRFIIRTLERMSANYEFLASDDLTDSRELTEYLALGRLLELVPDGLLAELEQQFGNRLGKVTARYVVRFDHKSIHDAFTALKPAEIEQLTRRVARRLVAARFVQSRERAHLAAVGVAYANDEVARIFYDEGFTRLQEASIQVRLPAAVTGGAAMTDTIGPANRDARKQILVTLFDVERSLSSRLAKLDQAIDDARTKRRAVPAEELEASARAAVSAAAELDRFDGPNAFFAVFDELIAIGGNGRAHRASALVLEIVPPGGQPVTRMFMQGTKEAHT